MKTIIATKKAPAAIGPYSQAVAYGGLLYSAGQIAIDPQSGQVEGDVAEQTRIVMNNLGHILEEGGSSLELILKTTIYLVDMDAFPIVNEVYAEFFHEAPPARSTVAVAALPKGALVEIEAVAALMQS
jgi:2-iminobutanoate/2-iminopropanoate deaminase